MKTSPKFSLTFNRSLLALSLGCALAALPLSAGAQGADPTSPTDPTAATPPDAPSTGQPATAVQPTPVPKGVATEAKLSTGDKMLVRMFANGNDGEIELAKLAMTNSDSQDIKDFAQKMIDDHGKANEDLKSMAAAHDQGVKPQQEVSEKAMYAKMKDLKGSNFDSAYIKHAVADHETDVKDYQKGKKTAKNPELVAYIDKTLPIIEGHLKMAKELAKNTNPSKKKA